MLSQAQRTALSRYLSLVVSAGDRGVRRETLPYESSMESSKARGDKAQRVEAYDRYVGDFSHRIRVIFSQYHATPPPADWRPAPAPRPHAPRPSAPAEWPRQAAPRWVRRPKPAAEGDANINERNTAHGNRSTGTPGRENPTNSQKIANAVGSRG